MLLLLAPALAAAAAAAGAPAALVTEVGGDVAPAVGIYDEIDAGTELSLGQGATLVIEHYASCEAAKVTGGVVGVLAKELDLPVMIHTPHRDKKRGASRSMDVIIEHGLKPSRVVIDHVNEETVREVKDRGFWAAFSIYPHSKMTAERMIALVREYGPERLIADSACDWGVSDPLSVPKTALMMEKAGIPAEHIRLVTYANALSAYGQSGQMSENDWLAPQPIDQRTLYQGNTVLRGGQSPRIDRPS